jgi:hypothetical protein
MAQNVRLIGSYKSDLASASATSTAAGYDVDNVVVLDRNSIWVAGGTGAINLTLDLGSAKSVSAVGIANHNGHLWTGGVLRASTDNFAASNDLIATFSGMADGSDYYHAFNSASYQYWRIATTSSTSAMQVGIFYLGLSTVLTQNPDIGMATEDVYNVERAVAQSGAIVAEQWGRRLLRPNLVWSSGVTTAAKDELRDFLRTEGGPLRPFWYVPLETSTTPVNGRGYLVRLVPNTFRTVEIFTGLWGMAAELLEEV